MKDGFFPLLFSAPLTSQTWGAVSSVPSSLPHIRLSGEPFLPRPVDVKVTG